MNICHVPDYNGLIFSGCSFEVVDDIEEGRVYGPVLEYGVLILPIIAVFDFTVRAPCGLMYNFPLVNRAQHLTSDDQIDYHSFISLN